jgi:hypothetical protein
MFKTFFLVATLYAIGKILVRTYVAAYISVVTHKTFSFMAKKLMF